MSCWSNRVVAVEIGDFRLVNVYAPNTPVDREHFFTSLQRLPWSPKATFRAGDFNSVQSPPLGRLGGTRSGRPESAAFQALITSINLVDARILRDNVNGDGDEPDPTDFLRTGGLRRRAVLIDSTCRKPCRRWCNGCRLTNRQCRRTTNGCSCISRMILSLIILCGGSVVLHTPSYLRSLLRFITELVVDLIAEGVGHNVTAATWDVTARPCVHCIRRVRKRAGQRRKAVVRRLQAQSRARLLTRKELLAVTFEEAREEHLARLGSR
uniref:Endonuclease/exonuclease/phosphatase domain-containing protein n=1 Tax=Hyaloperonospora arabidopsidis (strain Emoy2) TaxID=559515 RepID=M4BXQ9_HYAAE